MGISRIPALMQITKEFTSSGTWTCPGGVYSAEFLVVGAGGAGGGTGASTTGNHNVGGGGGGGAVKKVQLPVTPGKSYTITIGAKGTGASAAAGGNGGFSEILDGATTLIRAFGGGGGCGRNTSNAEVRPTASANVAGGGGRSSNNTSTEGVGGGGGGALASVPFTQLVSTAEAYFVQENSTYGLEGAFGKNSTSNGTLTLQSVGGAGIDGFGAGGGGGTIGTTAQTFSPASNAPYGAGSGARLTATGQTAGSAAIENTGCGGGGAAIRASTTSVAGGNGADGIVRITYVG